MSISDLAQRSARPCALSLLLVSAACVAPQRSWEEGAQTPITPQRPTIARKTSTTAVGTVEVEAGMERAPSETFSMPVFVKYGIFDRNEAFLAFSPYNTVELAGNDGEGFGDITLGWRQRFLEQNQNMPSLAWQAALKLPTADEDDALGTGELDGYGALSGTYGINQWTVTGFGQLGLLGDPNSSGADVQYVLSGAADYAYGPTVDFFGEVGGIFTPEYDNEVVLLTLGGGWSPSVGLRLDTGFRVGLSDDAPDFSYLVGFTRNLGRVSGWALRLPKK